MYIVYVLKSESANKGYVGFTDNMARRLAEHNSGKNTYTKRHIPWQIIHREEYKTKEEARKREVYLKTASGRRFLKTLFI